MSKHLEITYLAVPYTHSSPLVMEARYIAASVAANYLFAQGKPCFSPITHTHPIKTLGKHPLGHRFEEWQSYDFQMIRGVCSSVTVLLIDGWRTSVGVQAEIDYAIELGLPVHQLQPEKCGLCFEFPYDCVPNVIKESA